MIAAAEPVRHQRPAARDSALVIEVSSSSRRKDRRKADVYARVVVVYREPCRKADIASYRYARDFVRGETLTSAEVGGLSIEANFLLQLAE